MKKVLTIAGSDSGGGAGIQADLKTFISRGVYGMSVLTALTAQNTVGVQGILNINTDFIEKQIDSIMTDIGADAWKTGMLSNSDIIKIVSKKAIEYDVKKLVVDPVMVAKSGDSLLKKDAIEALIYNLIPVSYVLTPNHYEAEVLTDIKIQNIGNMYLAAQKIHDMGANIVIIKGGHLPIVEEAIDLLFDGSSFVEYHTPRIKTKNTHGTGCTFASAIAAELAKEYKIIDAVHIAKAYIVNTMKSAINIDIGKGFGPLNHSLGQIVQVDLESVKVIQ